MLVSMVFCYAQWCADKTTSVMKTLVEEEREGKRKRGFTAELYEKCSANRRLVVAAAILGGELAAEGAVACRDIPKTAN